MCSARYCPGPCSQCSRSLAVVFMLYKIRCNPMHPFMVLYLAVPFVPVRVTCGALVAHRCTYALLRWRTSPAVPQDSNSPLSVSVDVLADPVFDVVGLACFN